MSGGSKVRRVWRQVQGGLKGADIVGLLFKGALFGAVALALVMALVSEFNSHPDEYIHYKAVEYYSEGNWLPPVIGDPDTLDTYSIYGHSRLNLAGGFYYLLAGKFAALLNPLTGSIILGARLFNVLMFFVLVLLALKTSVKRFLLFGVLLLTPQVWYIYSYINSDAFALFLALLITYQIVNEESGLRVYLITPGLVPGIHKVIVAVIMVGMLYFAKDNYYLFLLFLVFWSLWFLYKVSDRKQMLLKYLIVALLLLLFIGAVQGLDYFIHGPEKADNLRAVRDVVAGEGFRLEDRASGDSYYGLNLRWKGVSYLDLFKDYNWHRLTFYSFTGVYGYMTVFGSVFYYQLMGFFLLALFLLVAIDLWSLNSDSRVFLIVAVLLTGLMVFLSSYHSWVVDFQAQGRYLFPVLGIYAYLFGCFYEEAEKRLPVLVLMLFIALASAYSFVYYGLATVPNFS